MVGVGVLQNLRGVGPEQIGVSEGNKVGVTGKGRNPAASGDLHGQERDGQKRIGVGVSRHQTQARGQTAVGHPVGNGVAIDEAGTLIDRIPIGAVVRVAPAWRTGGLEIGVKLGLLPPSVAGHGTDIAAHRVGKRVHVAPRDRAIDEAPRKPKGNVVGHRVKNVGDKIVPVEVVVSGQIGPVGRPSDKPGRPIGGIGAGAVQIARGCLIDVGTEPTVGGTPLVRCISDPQTGVGIGAG